MKNLYLTLIVLTFFSSFSLAQRKDKREVERKQFITEISRLIGFSQDKEVTNYVNKDLTKLLLETDKCSDERFNQMNETVQLIIEKRHQGYPHAYNYVVAFSSLLEKEKPNTDIDKWHAIVEELLNNRNPRRVTDFLQSTADFFHQSILAKDPNFLWYSYGEDYELLNDKSVTIEFKNTTLICKTINKGRDKRDMPFSDSLKIENTSGSIDLTRERWEGKGGTFTFEKVGLKREETNATLQNYSISLKATNFSADSVILKTPYINEPVIGRLMDRAAKGSAVADDNKTFPQFTSYKADFTIKNLVENVDYQGGFSLTANEFVGIGNKEDQAKLTYYKDNKIFVVSYSDQVRIKNETLKTPMAEFTLYTTRKDSIYHPGLDITYNTKTEIINFARGSRAVTQAPFINSFHKINMYVEELNMDLNSTEIILAFNKTTAEQQRVATFESMNYYDEQLFQRIQGLSSVNPLTALYNYAWKYDKFQMDEGTAATALNTTLQQARPRLLELSTQGFITYDTERGIVIVNEKTENFVKAKSGKIDYDNISFTSDLAPIRTDNINQRGEDNPDLIQKINQKNKDKAAIREYGILDLSSMDLTINSVDIVPISVSSRTMIYPNGNIITMSENRNMYFDGWISSGKWEVEINDGDYNYSTNTFNILESEIAYFNVEPQQEKDGDRMIPLQSSISGIKGELMVNDVSNRSGIKKDFGHYPILTSREKTKVFYDNTRQFKDAYDKERFYFEVEPFTVDSLLTFNSKDIRFEGTLVSAGIFPSFKDNLKIMPDYSLGFSKDLPKEGYIFYGTSGKYENKILLSNNGLQGSGTINFLNSTSVSKELFTFLPDSTIGVARFVNEPSEKGVEFPDAIGEDVFITYVPGQKILKAKANYERISLFNEEAMLGGVLNVKENGITGSGELLLDGALMESQNYKFKRWVATADTSNFSLINKYKTEGDITEDPLALRTVNVKGKLDFKERIGHFVSNYGESVVEFPANEYICRVDQFTWLMDKDDLALEKADDSSDDISIESGINIRKSNFFSVQPKQDSLQFRSPKARFNLKERRIYAFDVDYIDVADVRIFPDSSKLVIHRKAKMEELHNAEISANSITQYHRIKNATVNINGRRAYNGSGDYEYGLPEDEKQYVHLSDIKLDASYRTVAQGSIKEAENFKLSELFDFYGNIELKADERFLNFIGATKINHNCKKFERNWMSFEAYIDPANIQIPISEQMKDLHGNEISVGIRWKNDEDINSVHLYPTFLSKVELKDDPSIISASGYLQYSASTGEYQISSKEKLVNRNEPGNFISLHTGSCSLNGNGKISLGMNFGQVETEAYGVVNYNQKTDITDLNVTLAIKAPVDARSFEKLGSRINREATLAPLDFNSTTLEMALLEWSNQRTADKFKSDYTLKNEVRTIPKDMQDAIVITGLKLTSYTPENDEMKGLKSNTNDSYIVNIFKEPVMKKVPLKFFANFRGKVGDRFSLLIDIPASNKYFIDYDFRRDGIMEIATNDAELTDDIEKIKPAKKKIRRFSYDIVESASFVGQFMRIFNE